MLTIFFAMLETDDERIRLAEIYKEHEPYMLRYAMVMLKDRYAAEDAVHNAFVSIIVHKEKYFSLSYRDIRALFVIIVKSKCIDYLRHQNNIVIEQLEDMEPFLKSDELPVEKQVVLNEEYAVMLKHMKTLDDVSKTVLEMKYVLGMSYKEIAKELGTSPKHIDTRIQRAKAKLRKLTMVEGKPDER